MRRFVPSVVLIVILPLFSHAAPKADVRNIADSNFVPAPSAAESAAASSDGAASASTASIAKPASAADAVKPKAKKKRTAKKLSEGAPAPAAASKAVAASTPKAASASAPVAVAKNPSASPSTGVLSRLKAKVQSLLRITPSATSTSATTPAAGTKATGAKGASASAAKAASAPAAKAASAPVAPAATAPTAVSASAAADTTAANTDADVANSEEKKNSKSDDDGDDAEDREEKPRDPNDPNVDRDKAWEAFYHFKKCSGGKTMVGNLHLHKVCVIKDLICDQSLIADKKNYVRMKGIIAYCRATPDSTTSTGPFKCMEAAKCANDNKESTSVDPREATDIKGLKPLVAETKEKVGSVPDAAISAATNPPTPSDPKAKAAGATAETPASSGPVTTPATTKAVK